MKKSPDVTTSYHSTPLSILCFDSSLSLFRLIPYFILFFSIVFCFVALRFISFDHLVYLSILYFSLPIYSLFSRLLLTTFCYSLLFLLACLYTFSSILFFPTFLPTMFLLFPSSSSLCFSLHTSSFLFSPVIFCRHFCFLSSSLLFSIYYTVLLLLTSNFPFSSLFLFQLSFLLLPLSLLLLLLFPHSLFFPLHFYHLCEHQAT